MRGVSAKAMVNSDLQQEFDRRGPWITKFVIEGTEYGGDFDPLADPRVKQFFQWFPNACEILELGCLEGGHTMALARQVGVKRIVGVDARSSNLKKAAFVREVLGLSNIEFQVANLEMVALPIFGKFDAIFCSGLLYHLPEPWKLISQFPQVSGNLFVWTHYADDQQAKEVRNGYTGKSYQEAGTSDPLSGLSKVSFWPTLSSLIRMLTLSGYHTIHILENNLIHPHGPCVTLAATLY